MKYFFFSIIRLLSCHYPFNPIMFLRGKWAKIQTEWIAGKIAEVGKDCYFRSVAQLHDPQYIHIGDNNCFGKDLYLTAWGISNREPNLSIGNNCSFGAYNHITCANKVTIGNGPDFINAPPKLRFVVR